MNATQNLHPKTGGAAAGAAAGVLLVAVLHQLGVHLVVELPGAIAGFAAALGAWLAPTGKAS